MNYVIEKTYQDQFIINYPKLKGFAFSPKKSKNYSHIKKITILDPKIIEKKINNKLNKEYKKIIKIFYNLLESDDTTDSDILVTFTELKILKDIFLFKYKKLLKKELFEEYLKKLKYLELELNKLNYQFNLNFEEERGMGR